MPAFFFCACLYKVSSTFGRSLGTKKPCTSRLPPEERSAYNGHFEFTSFHQYYYSTEKATAWRQNSVRANFIR